jgi:hypothetical protein
MSATYVPFEPDRRAIDNFFNKAIQGRVNVESEAVPIGVKKSVAASQRAAPTQRVVKKKHKRRRAKGKVVKRRKQGEHRRSRKRYKLEKKLRNYRVTK